jgi:ZIP family zinc transporter
MNIFMPLLVSSLAGLSTVLGSFIIFMPIKKENINKFISMVLSFSLAIMIGISITDLIPNSLDVLLKYDLIKGVFISIVSFILGIILIKILSIKINKAKLNNESLYKLGILNMIALLLHNFPEGIATFLSSMQNISLGIKLSIAIALHNVPEGISIAVPIYYSTNNKKDAIKKTFISGLAEPIGAILAFILFKNYITSELISIILLIVAGIMITISIEDIYPEALKYKENKSVIIGLILGLIVILISYFCF